MVPIHIRGAAVFVLQVCWLFVPTRPAVATCTEPSETDLRAQYEEYYNQHCTDYGYGLHHVIPHQMTLDTKGMLGEETSCPDAECEDGMCCTPWQEEDEAATCTMDATSPEVRHRSLCPYTFLEVTHVDLYPRRTLEAKCKCLNCQASPNVTVAAGCERVLYHVPMLRRTGHSVDGTCEYVKTLHPIPVGCACAVMHQSDP